MFSANLYPTITGEGLKAFFTKILDQVPAVKLHKQ